MKDIQQTSFVDLANDHIQRNKTALIGLVILLLAGFGSYAAYDAYKNKYEEEAQSAFFEAEKLHVTNQGAKAFTDTNKKEQSPVDTSQVEAKLNAVMEEYPKSTAAKQAALLGADIYISKKENDRAIAILEKSFANFSGHLADSLVALKLSNLYEQNKQCDKALPILQEVYNSKTPELKPEILLRQALCEESLGQTDKAKQSYQKLATEFSDSSQGQQAQKYLKVL